MPNADAMSTSNVSGQEHGTSSSETPTCPQSRPASPSDSLMTRNSLYRATATVDELTQTLAKVSRAPSPDSSEDTELLLSCCCGRGEQTCERLRAWRAFQGKLEGRLILCAEVGQALLEKHEAYVRRHGLDEDDDSDTESTSSRPETPTLHSSQAETFSTAELKERNKDLEKRLHTAMVDAEVADTGRKALIEELEDLKESLSKLSVAQARSAGWEARLSSAEEDRDDLQQELDAERQRSRTAEAQLGSLREHCDKLQSDFNRVVVDESHAHRHTRTELSEEILRDARARLAMVQQQRFGRHITAETPEVTEVMESLVADNEALKRDVAELQNYLTDSREEVRMLRDEVEESRAQTAAIQRTSTAASRTRHNHAQSWASSYGRTPLSPPMRSGSVSSHGYEPLTPNTQARPLSPESQAGPSTETRLPPVASPKPKYPPASLNLDAANGSRVTSPELTGRKSPRKPLLLLTQSRGVQTEEVKWSSLFGPVFSPRPGLDDSSSSATPSGGDHSESSSLVDTTGSPYASTVAALVDKASRLFARMSQADALTLTNRLKRQRLAGDVSHLSHSTVQTILSEANALRGHFRTVLEDERAVSTCTRRDLRTLLNLFKEIFAELGVMRIALNDVILDPSLAPKLREFAMDPTKGLEAAARAGPRSDTQDTNALGWMAPLSKLFGTVVASQAENKSTGLVQPVPRKASASVAPPEQTLRSKPSKFVPKSGPALAATATTVNVEFSGSGVGRSTTSDTPAPRPPPIPFPDTDIEDRMERSKTPMQRPGMGAGGTMSSRAVMDIFAGAPKAPSAGADPWIILPSSSSTTISRPRKQQSAMDIRTATLNRSAGRWAAGVGAEGAVAHRLPRNVDAVVDVDSMSAILDDDDEEVDMPNLLERTLRPRGLSDSSIRSSFLNDDPSSSSSVSFESPVVHGNMNVPTPTPVSPLPPGRGTVRNKRNSIRMSGGPPPSIGSSGRQGAWPGAGMTRTSVFQAFSRAFTVPAFSAVPIPAAAPPKTQDNPLPSEFSETAPHTHNHSRKPSNSYSSTIASSPVSTSSPVSNLASSSPPASSTLPTSSRKPHNKILPSLAHWAGLDAAETAEFVGSVRREHAFDEDGMGGLNSPLTAGRAWRLERERDMPGRDL